MSDMKAANMILIVKNSPLTRFLLGQQLVHHDVWAVLVVLHTAYAYISKIVNLKSHILEYVWENIKSGDIKWNH